MKDSLLEEAAQRALEKFDALSEEELKAIMLDPKYNGLYHHISDMTLTDEDIEEMVEYEKYNQKGDNQ